jgi:hypothetical protein
MKKFGELTREEQIELFEAWLDGEAIEYFNCAWVTCPHPPCTLQKHYRVKPTPPSINWDHISLDFNWLAKDKNGDGCVYKSKPSELEFIKAENFTSYKPGTCDWEDSLVRRPDEG